MNDDLTGQRVGSALRNHLPATPRAPFDLADVKGRAGGIRRRRTFATTAAGALVLVAAGPFVATTLTDDGGPAPAASPARAPDLALPPEVTLATDAPLDQASGGSGSWVVGDASLGTGLPVPPGAQDGVTLLGSRWLIAYAGENGERKLYSIDLGEETGESVAIDEAVAQARTHDLHDRVAVSDGGDLAVFSTPAGELTLVGEDGSTRVVTTLPAPGTPVDLVGDSGCLTGADCEVLVSYGDGAAPEAVAGDGTRRVLDRSAAAVTAATDDLVVTRAAESEPGASPCSVVRDRETLDERWRSCEVGVEAFSPDGAWAVVVDAYQPGAGTTRRGLAEADTGRVLTWFLPGAEEGFVRDLVWTPEGDLEVTTFTSDDQTWRLFRVTSKGEVSQRAQGRPGDEGDAPHIAITRP